MFHLTKDELYRKALIIKDLDECKNRIEDEVRVLRERLRGMVAKVNEQVALYNSAAQAAQDFAEEVGARMREEHDEKSETWQESDWGMEVSDFISGWENFSSDQLDNLDIEVTEYDIDHCAFVDLEEIAS